MLFAVIVANLVTQCGFGLTPVVIKKFAALSGANPLIFCLYRDSLAFPVFLLVSRVMERKLIFPSLAQIPVLFALGFFGSYGNQLLYILGLYNSNPNIASTFGNTLPAWAVLLGILVKLEPFDSKTLYSWVKIVSIIGAVAGAVEITLTSGLTGGGEGIAEEEFSTARNASEARPYSHLVLGCFLLLFSAFCMALHLVLQKLLIQNSVSKLMENWKGYPMNIMSWSYGFGAFCYALSSLYFVHQGELEVFLMPFKAVYSLAYTILITSVTCYLCLSWANYHSSPTLVTAFWPVQVVVTMVAAYYITGDVLHSVQYIGVFLIVAGLFGVVYATHKEQKLILMSKQIV